MKKSVVVAMALLVCAFVLGAAGVLLVNGNTPVFDTTTENVFGETSFCDPVVDPSCWPPGGSSSFCDPVVDPSCWPPGP